MGLHIGREIERKYKESGIKLSEFAKRLNTSPRNIYDIFERSEIKTDQLQKISQVLHFNFFSLFQVSNDLQEPESKYFADKKNRKTLSVVIELDGEEATLNQWIQRLSEINKTLQ